MAAASPKEQFEAAVNLIQSLPKNATSLIGSFQPSNEMMLKFYAYYKQATQGPCDKPKPAFWDVVNKYKWEAWNKLGKLPPEEAMTLYVDELKKIIEAMPHTEMVAEFVEKLGSFYEVVDDKVPKHLANGKTIAGKIMKKAESVSAPANGSGGAGDAAAGLVNDRGEYVGPLNESYLANENQTSSSDTLPNSSHKNADLPNSVTVVEVPLQASVKSKQNGRPTTPDTSPSSSSSSSPSAPASPLHHNGMNGHGSSPRDAESGEESDADEFCDTSDIPDELPELLSPLPRDRLSGSSASDINTSSLSSVEHTHIDEELDQSNQHMNYDQTENSSLSDRVIGQHSVIRKHTDIIMARGGGDVMATHGGQGSPVNAYNAGGYNNSQRNQIPMSSEHSVGGASSHPSDGAAGGGGGQQNPCPPATVHGEVNEQIALALLRLQQDMNSVLSRLNTLEALTVAQTKREEKEQVKRHREGGWWLFPRMPARTVAFIIIWPFVVHWLFKMMKRPRRH